MKEYWLRVKDSDKPMLVRAESEEVFVGKGLIKLTRVFKNGETTGMLLRSESITSVVANTLKGERQDIVVEIPEEEDED